MVEMLVCSCGNPEMHRITNSVPFTNKTKREGKAMYLKSKKKRRIWDPVPKTHSYIFFF